MKDDEPKKYKKTFSSTNLKRKKKPPITRTKGTRTEKKSSQFLKRKNKERKQRKIRDVKKKKTIQTADFVVMFLFFFLSSFFFSPSVLFFFCPQFTWTGWVRLVRKPVLEGWFKREERYPPQTRFVRLQLDIKGIYYFLSYRTESDSEPFSIAGLGKDTTILVQLSKLGHLTFTIEQPR